MSNDQKIVTVALVVIVSLVLGVLLLLQSVSPFSG